MGKVHPAISDELARFIATQPLFFVATAPLAGEGHVNLSPKGLDCLALLGPDRVAYLDLTGSGNETAAHLVENGRITLMFCSFQGRPQILRLYGRGEVAPPGSSRWEELIGRFPSYPGARHIVEIERVQTSCGFAVPLMAYERQRDTLLRWAENKGEEGLIEYRATKNERSIDGLPTHASATAGGS